MTILFFIYPRMFISNVLTFSKLALEMTKIAIKPSTSLYFFEVTLDAGMYREKIKADLLSYTGSVLSR